MQENIMPPDLSEDIPLLQKFRDRLRRISRRFQLLMPFHAVEFHQHGQIQRPLDSVNILFLHHQFFFEYL